MCQDCIKRLPNRRLFLVFGCLLIVVFSCHYVLKFKGYSNTSAPVFQRPSAIQYPNRNDTKSGYSNTSVHVLKSPSAAQYPNRNDTKSGYSNTSVHVLKSPSAAQYPNRNNTKSGYSNTSAPVFKPPSSAQYSNRTDTKSGYSTTPASVLKSPSAAQDANRNDPTSAPIFKPPSAVQYRNPNDTKSGECLKNYFEDILLVIVYHFPFYDSIPLLKSFYEDAFKDILICGKESYAHHYVMVVDLGPGYYGYECAAEAIRRYPGYRGYLYVNDDMVVNWWTFSNLDKEKFWQGAVVAETSHVMGSRPIRNDWPWWIAKSKSAEACEDSYSEITQKNLLRDQINITKLVNTHLVNGEGKKRCFNMWSDLFYVPKKFSNQFQRISFVFHKNRVFLECAVPTIMSFLDLRDSWDKHFGLYLPDRYGYINFADGKFVWKNYNYDINFIHPVKFNGDIAKTNREKLKYDIIPYSKRFTKC